MENALDRLQKSNEASQEREFTLEEQMESVSTDEYLDGMSFEARQEMSELANPTVDLQDDGSDEEELFINNNKEDRPKRGRRKKVSEASSEVNCTESNPVFDQLVKDLIDDLRQNHYKINRFDDKSMDIIFNYMHSKF